MNYQLTITKSDLPYVIEAIGLRAATLQESLRMQARDIEEQERRKADEARRAAMPDPFQAQTITVPVETPPAEEPAPVKASLEERRALLKKMLADKTMKDWSTSAISRACGMSYVTVAKARKKKGRK